MFRRRRRREREKERPISTETLEREKEREKGRRGQRPRRKETRENSNLPPIEDWTPRSLSRSLSRPTPASIRVGGMRSSQNPARSVPRRRSASRLRQRRGRETERHRHPFVFGAGFPADKRRRRRKKNVIIIVIIARRKKNASQTRSPTKGHARFHPATARQTARFSLASVPRSSAGSGPRRS